MFIISDAEFIRWLFPKHSFHLRPLHARKPFQKRFNRGSVAQIIKQGSDGNPCSPEHPGSAHLTALFLLACTLCLAGCQAGTGDTAPTGTAPAPATPAGHTPTPRPSLTPSPTPAPTATAKVIQVTPGADEVLCPRPESLPDTEVDVSGPPFCIVWVDPFDDETGYQVHLEYLQSNERFIYETRPDTVQLIVPQADAPRLEESQEQCLRRQAFTITIIALRAGTTRPVNSMTMQTECGSIEDSSG